MEEASAHPQKDESTNRTSTDELGRIDVYVSSVRVFTNALKHHIDYILLGNALGNGQCCTICYYWLHPFTPSAKIYYKLHVTAVLIIINSRCEPNV